MFLFKGLITYGLLAIINLVQIGDLCIFGIRCFILGIPITSYSSTSLSVVLA